MSLELPPASSLRPARARRRPHRRVGLATIAGAAGLAAVLFFGYYGLSLLQRPRLERLEPSIGEPGGEVLLEGRNFGDARDDSWIDVDGLAPTASSYLSWGGERIRLRLPADFDSGLLRVVTGKGASNPLLFMNRGRLPILASGVNAGTAPSIASLSPEEGPIGSLVTLSGAGFGEEKKSSKVQFAWSADDAGGLPLGDRTLPTTVEPTDSDLGYEAWSDKEILVRVPDGAVSGSVFLVSRERKQQRDFLPCLRCRGLEDLFLRDELFLFPIGERVEGFGLRRALPMDSPAGSNRLAAARQDTGQESPAHVG